MAWVDREHIPVLEQDYRYTRLLNLTRRLLEAEVPVCGNCSGGTITVRDDDGNEITVDCDACGGTGEVGTMQDNEDDGQAGGRSTDSPTPNPEAERSASGYGSAPTSSRNPENQQAARHCDSCVEESRLGDTSVISHELAADQQDKEKDEGGNEHTFAFCGWCAHAQPLCLQ